MQTGKRKQIDWSGVRLIFVAVCFALLLGGLWSRAYYIQIMQGDKLARKANRQYWAKHELEGKRGEIQDRHGNLLAKSVEAYSVYTRPEKVRASAKTAEIVAERLNISKDEVLKKLKQRDNFVWIERKIGDIEARRLKEAQLQGIYLTTESRRFYPQGQLAGQLLGFVGIDNQGLEGLELAFDSYLAGKDRKYILQRDASGKLLYDSVQPGAATCGQDLVLTLDSRLQMSAEQALGKVVRKFKANYGMCLVVEVSSGEILAWAHYPRFNPNNYQDSSPSRWRNKIAMDAFEPGSTMKPFVVAAALEENVCKPEDIYFCENGKWMQAGHKIRDTHEYGWLTVNKIIRYSSNIGAAKIGMQLGAQKYHSYLRNLGFGQSTELPLPGESQGVLRPFQRWRKLDLLAASFGQGLSASTLQLAQAYLCLANKGRKVPFKLVLDPAQTKEKGKQVFSSATARKVLGMLQEVVEEDGTGTKVRISGMQVGGKTGTAQKADPEGGYGEKYTASFVGLFPALEPEYLVVAIVDEPEPYHYGGVVAAPAVKDVALETLALYGDLPEQDPQKEIQDTDEKEVLLVKKSYSGKVKGSSLSISASSATVPDFTGIPLRNALEVLMRKGMVPELKGEGVLVGRQKPAPGSPWPKSPEDGVKLWLEPLQGRS